MTDFDIAVCGAGPVGLALALLAVKRGIPAHRIALIDSKSIALAGDDPRSIALSYGSRQILEQIGAWPITADAIHEIHVSRRGHFGRTLIDRAEFNIPALGYVTRYGTLFGALARCADAAGLTSLRETHVASIEESESSVSVTLSDGNANDHERQRILSAKIAVQAEGGVFSEQAGRALRRDYRQTAVVAQVRVGKTLPHRAFERFTEEGPLALLPQDDGYALVWCVRPERAAELLCLPDTAFLSALAASFGTRLGKFVRATPRVSFPLGLNAHAAKTARTVVIGNAAQTLHPVAGQGLNLGLRDAMVLAQNLSRGIDPETLDRFVANRQSDRSLTIRLTDTMARIFASAPDGAASQSVLGASLGLVDMMNPAKRVLAERMMFGWR